VSTFLSHNSRDKDFARALGAQLSLVGVAVWFDEWEIRAGDSIPRKLNDALESFDDFVLIWSENAARSNWVRAELEAALHHHIDNNLGRVIPLVLDATPVPALLKSLRRIDVLENDDLMRVVREITGIATEAEYLKALQQHLDELPFDYDYFPGYGLIVACPRCGARVGSLEHSYEIDYERDDQYAGARCTVCNWQGGGEI
jgi:hypothetical protein